ncbi:MULTISPECIES: excinuclease ABC subunit UvrC [unclassified Clostridioides]|uniref:excinuclease ABC subunit UvrC n=1 Tax=unclassified Clostridioides TaxID=2635829 RepID=UPI001D1095ED|nr:excinuclease ABC subunit UvrC [Clostridioides sp. ZZV14-6150]MCC0660723.1 excinuclease ABC subunit UvrC [Clostridioides sp. ZZV14-6154]MCC0669789.1 excinuclease ABC subunit UvrC [Clostridioides sp. ZZV14-6153]MCC0724198.1 excinuclease ABC subunit UvrC [Clostridioides sp. ZZV14-6104]MCC0727723.1 excinuclease ABC subunit UvrC [Clostridioides sp. ZZV14-6045]MCC0732422.1 excinuclease ABC subunit UvrC [Clostridioides sp. ZZV14-6048]MCC0736468.1 excinuclease ABC subunit UvrC [Clostridioides sp. 
MFDIQDHLKKLPSEPGVYLMKDKYDHIIYVGKAISLKNRVRQYFQSSKNHTSKVKSMVKNIYKFEYIITDSELEALILECNLIKRYRPKYNVLLRDDKTYPYIKVTTNEDYPRILKVRRVLKDKAKYFGPYTNITAVNDTLDLINSTYPIRSCKIDIEKAIKNKTRPCLNLHINKCLGPCTGKVSKEEYGKMIEEIIMCLSGKEEKLMELLKEKMNESSMNFRFEEAAIYRDKIKGLEEMIQKQKIDATVTDLNQDVVAMARAHNEACVQVFFIRNGKIVGREHFILEGVMDSPRASILSSFVKQFYNEQEYIPKELIIEDEIEDSCILEEWLSSKKGQKVTIRVPQKGEKKSLVEMVRKNAVEYLEKFSDMNKRKYEKSIGALEELKRLLNLEKLPIRIESFDISNIQGVDSIGSMVVYTNAKKDKKEYRRYKIKTVIGPNDYDSMAEIVDRRLKHGNLPDLILLDGGKGQVSAVKKVLELNDVDIPLWGMYKDDKHRTKGLICKEKEIELDKTTSLYRFIASIQEEVHNYAITYHRSLRNKALTKSILDDIQGIGEKRKKALLSHFKDVEAIKEATFEELLEVEGMNKSIAENVYNFFRKEEN